MFALHGWVGRTAGLALILSLSAFAQQNSKKTATKPDETVGPPAPQPRGDKPSLRERWFYEQRAFPLGFIPSRARERALQRLEEMERAEKAGRLAAVAPPAANGTSWTSIGPQPIQSSFFGNVSGRVSAVAVHPTNPDIVYVGGAQGGVWKSINAGATWTPLTDFEASLAIGAIAIDPGNPNVVYVGTGEQTNSIGSYYGAGILKSTDAGATWTLLGQSVFQGPFSPIPLGGGATISSLAIHPTSPNIVLAGVLIRPSSGPGTDGSTSGVYCSDNSGLSWQLVLAGAGASEVVFDTLSPNIAYAALGDTNGDAQNGVYKTTSAGSPCAQQAAGWQRSDAGAPVGNRLPTVNVGRIEIALAPSTTGAQAVLYAGIEDTSTNGDLLGMFRSADGGVNWSQLDSTPDYCTAQCWYDHVIRVHPADSSVVFAGGAAVSFGTGGYLIRTTNAGGSWTGVAGTGIGPQRLHVDIQSMAFAALPGGGFRLYVGNDGGIWRADLVTPTTVPAWINLNGDGVNPSTALSISQYYPGHSIDPSNVRIGYGGTQDNGTQKFTNDFLWQDINVCGDGGFTAIDPSTPTTVYAACQQIDINRSTNSGATFQSANGAIDPDERSAFIPPLVIDSNANTAPFPAGSRPLYFGTFRVWQSTDGATTWTAISPDLTPGSGSIRAIAVAPSDSRIVYAGTSGGRVQRTIQADAGANAAWTNLTTSELPGRVVTSLAVDPVDPNTAYVTYSGFSGFGSDSRGHVFKTNNGGASWTDISVAPVSTTPLPNTPANFIVVDPDVPGTLYVATDVGVFSSSNDGITWSPLMSGLPRVAVLGLALHRPTRTLRAGTHGRGMWDLLLTNFNPAFILSSISPTSVAVGAGDTTITVTGNGFVNGSSVIRINSTDLIPTNCASATQCSATIPAAFLTAGAAAQITVREPSAPAPSITNALVFSVTNPTPILTTISPTQTADGGPAFTLTANGTNFISSSVVRWNGSARPTTFVSATQLTAAIPASDIASPGSAQVTVQTPAPGGGTTVARLFAIGNPPVNDNVANAKIITTSPYTDTVNNAAALTSDFTDPSPTCAPGSNFKSVWYRFTPTTTVTNVNVNTTGSSYDTVLSAWTGNPGAFAAFSCDDDSVAPAGASQLPPLQLTAGTTYFFMVSSFSPTGGGTTTINLTVPATPPDIALAANPTSITVTRGQSGTSTITVTGLGGFNSAVSLTCTGLPAQSSCAFNPASVTPGAQPAASTLTITTTAGAFAPPLAPREPWPPAPRLYMPLLFMLAFLMLTAALVRRNRAWRTAFELAAIIVVALGFASCGGGGGGGGGSTNPPPVTGTPRGTFNVTVTGTSGATTRTTTVSLTVN